MDDQRKSDIEAAIRALGPDGYTATGKPSVDAIDDEMDTSAEDVTADERDEVWTAMQKDGFQPPAGDGSSSSSSSSSSGGSSGGSDSGGGDPAETQDFGTGQKSGSPDRQGTQTAASATPGHSVSPLPGAESYDEDAEDTTSTAPEGSNRIRLVSAPTDPLRIYVHGHGRKVLNVGEEASVTDEVLEALSRTDARYERVEDKEGGQ